MHKLIQPPTLLFQTLLLIFTLHAGEIHARQDSRHTRPRATASSNSERINLRESERSIRAQMEFLAADALQGRGSASAYELIAATYIAAQLRQFGVEPAGDRDASGAKTFLQTTTFTPRRRNPDAAAAAAPQQKQTWNVVGILQGSDPTLSKQVVLLSAHLDHLGTRTAADASATADTIYNGADDDASGVVAVLELAREMSRKPKPKRTIMFVFFGAEEIGGYGARHFLDNPPMPLDTIVANLEFEMIGRPDAKVAANTLWLTGYERSTLGAALARHGARLVQDPHPDQNFFQRSDNYQLARRGIIAHTVSSFGLHKEYHQPDDDLAHIDFAHMTRAINSMLKPIEWLANSNFIPTWVEGKKP